MCVCRAALLHVTAASCRVAEAPLFSCLAAGLVSRCRSSCCCTSSSTGNFWSRCSSFSLCCRSGRFCCCSGVELQQTLCSWHRGGWVSLGFDRLSIKRLNKTLILWECLYFSISYRTDVFGGKTREKSFKILVAWIHQQFLTSGSFVVVSSEQKPVVEPVCVVKTPSEAAVVEQIKHTQSKCNQLQETQHVRVPPWSSQVKELARCTRVKAAKPQCKNTPAPQVHESASEAAATRQWFHLETHRRVAINEQWNYLKVSKWWFTN